MNCRGVLSVPVRLISRSSSLGVKIPVGKGLSKKEIKLEDSAPLPVETDTRRLATHVCGTNLFIEGGEDVKLKPDSEYPEWLWKIRAPPPLEELDKNSKTYWNRIRGQKERQIKYLKSLDKTSTVHK